MAIASQLLDRYGIVTRELAASENPPGGFAGLYPVFKVMEETGRVRRGYFVAGQGAAQFALPGAEDRLRSTGRDTEAAAKDVLVLAATDPASPWGTAFRWPETGGKDQSRPSRTAGARVILVDGAPAGYLNRTSSHLMTFLPAEEPERSAVSSSLAEALTGLADESTPVFLEKIDGQPAERSHFADRLQARGFVPSSQGLLLRRIR